jgi:hypothetical protein
MGGRFLTLVVLSSMLLAHAGCFFLPFRPDTRDPYGDFPFGSDPDVDDDRDGFSEFEGDCDDADPTVSPGGEEYPNGADDDCDGEIDEEPEPVDGDGDGWTPEDGDCDDSETAVHPGHEDICDDLDNDCDGELNEDVREDDPYEPNDLTPYHLGDLTDASTSLAGYLHNGDDVDHFSFFVSDGLFDEPDIRVELSGIPGDADFVLELWRGTALLDISDTSGGEVVEYEGSMGDEDEGTYEAVIYSVLGYACEEPYVLSVEEVD